MRTTTPRQKFIIVLIVVLVLSVLLYADRPTYYNGKKMNVYYHIDRGCSRIADDKNVEKHSWVKARLIEGLTPCPDCSKSIFR